MRTPTYNEQWQKLTTAYINNHIEPFNNCACFVGNLLNNKLNWAMGRNYDFRTVERIGRRVNTSLMVISPSSSEYRIYCVKLMTECIKEECNNLYTPQDIIDIESLFLNTYEKSGGIIIPFQRHILNEDALFEAFSVTLDFLKTLHERKGELVDSTPVFTKRELQPA